MAHQTGITFHLGNVMVALLPSFVALMIKFLAIGVSDPADVDIGILALGLELPLVAFGIATGAVLIPTASQEEKARFIIPLVLIFIVMIITFICHFAILPVGDFHNVRWIEGYPNLWEVWIPNTLGVALVAYTAAVARS